jgi:hypothetical protein
MHEHEDDVRREHLRKLAPLFLIGGLALFAAPLFHPNNTCKDWLMKWGQLSASRIWIPIHQVASFGFALGAGAALLLALIGPRRLTGLCGGAMYAAGFGMMSMLAVMHATATSVLGAAFNAATVEADKQLLRTVANAFVTYDVATEGVAAVLISAGAVLLAHYLWRIAVISTPVAVVLAGVGAIWGAQYYRLLRVVHYSFPEWVPYVSLGLWLCATGLLIALHRGRETAAAAVAAAPA